MADFVYLELTRNRGWPWPEDNFGLSPMYGAEGWCPSCGTPQAEQSGPLMMQARGLGNTSGTWMPNWRFDVLCLDEHLAAQFEKQFSVRTREVFTPRGKRLPVRQLIVPVTPRDWFQPETLKHVLQRHHGLTGNRCPKCDIWRWLPLDERKLPPPSIADYSASGHAIASPEWFGDGMKSFRQMLFSRQLARAILEAGDADFVMHELPSGAA